MIKRYNYERGIRVWNKDKWDLKEDINGNWIKYEDISEFIPAIEEILAAREMMRKSRNLI